MWERQRKKGFEVKEEKKKKNQTSFANKKEGIDWGNKEKKQKCYQKK